MSGNSLQRYEMGRYNFGIPIKNPKGDWVRYCDVWTLDNNNFALRNDVKILEKRIAEFDGLRKAAEELVDHFSSVEFPPDCAAFIKVHALRAELDKGK